MWLVMLIMIQYNRETAKHDLKGNNNLNND